jgi:hypothetical protein
MSRAAYQADFMEIFPEMIQGYNQEEYTPVSIMGTVILEDK